MRSKYSSHTYLKHMVFLNDGIKRLTAVPVRVKRGSISNANENSIVVNNHSILENYEKSKRERERRMTS